MVWHDGSDPALMHNYYTFLYNKTVFDEVVRARGEGEAVLFARSATVGGQQFPVHWGGDCESSYQSMAESLRGGLSLGLGGFGFWSHDIGGFEGTPSAALFKRWTAFGLLSSHSRLHGSESYRVPWAFDEEAVEVTREFAELKNRLMPYLWGCAVEAHRVGDPGHATRCCSSSPTTGPADTWIASTCSGRTCSSRPCSTTRATWSSTCPGAAGWACWTGRSSTARDGCVSDHDFHSLPLLVRPGSVIAVGSRADRPDYDDALAPTFEVFDLADGDSSVTHLYDELGRERVSLRVARHGNEVVAEVVAGLEELTEGWRLTWATGPFGGRTGPTAEAASGQGSLVLDLGQHQAATETD